MIVRVERIKWLNEQKVVPRPCSVVVAIIVVLASFLASLFVLLTGTSERPKEKRYFLHRRVAVRIYVESMMHSNTFELSANAQ